MRNVGYIISINSSNNVEWFVRDSAPLVNNLGATLADQGRMAEAIRHYTVALQLHPRYVEPHFNLGNALRRQGQMAEAMQQYQAALRLKPTFAEAQN